MKPPPSIAALAGADNRKTSPTEGWFHFWPAYVEAVERAGDGEWFAEIGCWKGRSSLAMARLIADSGKDVRLFCIDTWRGSPEHQRRPDLDTVYATFRENLSPYPFVTALRESSVDAARRFIDGTLAFVWLDADHRYESVLADIRAWWPKLRAGGVMGGDDLDGPARWDVRGAVGEIFGPDWRESEGWWWKDKPA